MAGPATPRVLVAGATGQLGREVVRQLLARGVEVRVITRSRERAASLGATEVVVADARKPESLAQVGAGVDAVFSSVGASVALSLGAGWRGYRAVDVPANRNLLAATRSVPRFVYVSALVSEATRSLAYFDAHETVAAEVLARGGRVLRPTAFFSALAPLVDFARRGRVPLFGDGRAMTNPIADADLAAIAVAALLEEAPVEQDLGGPEVLSRREIADLAFAAVGKVPRYRAVGPGLARVMATCMTPFSPRLSQLVRFAAAVSRHDCVAPKAGTLRLGDFFASLGSGGQPATP